MHTLALLTLIAGLLGQNQPVRLPVIADTSLQAHQSETNCNSGASANIRVKGNEHYLLMKFDLAPIAGWRVTKATLFLHDAHPNKLRTIGLSTVATDWEEGTGTAGPARDGCTFTRAVWPDKLWAGPGSDFWEATLSEGHTLMRYADIQPGEGGWFGLDVDPALVHAMMSGGSHGLCLSDEKGQTYANNDVHSREQGGFAPYLIVEGGPADGLPALPELGPIAAEAAPASATFDTGAMALRLAAPEVFRYEVTYRADDGAARELPLYLTPRPQPGREQRLVIPNLPPGAACEARLRGVDEFGRRTNERVVTAPASPAKARPRALPAPAAPPGGGQEPPLAAGLRAWACPAECKVNPVTGNVLEEVGAEAYGGEAQGGYRRANPVWDGRVARLRAARGEVVALQVVVERAAGDAANPRLWAGYVAAQGETGLPEPVGIYRNWCVQDEGQWYAEYLAPLTGAGAEARAFELAPADNAVPNQSHQALTLLWELPLDLPPGRRTGELRLGRADLQPQVLTIPIEVEVLPLRLPVQTTFEVDLNCYGHVQAADDWPKYLRAEREYYNWAHRLRCTLNSVGYSHSGRMSRGYAPVVAGEGAEMTVSDWREWDERFGPYLDGSAFTGLRAGVPVTHMYLPFHEAWPTPIAGHYTGGNDLRQYPDNIALHALTAPLVEQAFDQAFKDAFVAITSQFVAHFRERGWTRTDMQCYQNNKYYYKDEKSDFRGTSWWLLDEPMHRDDWLALRLFARLYRQGLGLTEDGAIATEPLARRFQYRGDISRPHLQRDWLDGVMDVLCLSGALYEHPESARRFREQGVTLWHYGEANPVSASNLSGEAWALKAYCAGADGILPWLVIGGDGAFTTPTSTALFIPGTRFGLPGPVVSLRLLALCRGQQDVEYLNLLAKRRGYDRDQMAALVAQTLNLGGTQRQAFTDDAGNMRFDRLRPEDFTALRAAVAGALAE